MAASCPVTSCACSNCMRASSCQVHHQTPRLLQGRRTAAAKPASLAGVSCSGVSRVTIAIFATCSASMSWTWPTGLGLAACLKPCSMRRWRLRGARGCARRERTSDRLHHNPVSPRPWRAGMGAAVEPNPRRDSMSSCTRYVRIRRRLQRRPQVQAFGVLLSAFPPISLLSTGCEKASSINTQSGNLPCRPQNRLD